MKLFYGWVIVGVGIVVTCIGMGTMMSLGVFLQPMSQDMGWSRAGISFAAVLNFLAMGFGSFLWGSLSDRFGTRAVVLTGGVLLGVGADRGEPGDNAAAVPAAVRHPGRAGGGQLLCAADRDGDALVHRATAASPWRWSRPAWGWARCSIAPLSRWIITAYDWRTAMLTLGRSRLGRDPSRRAAGAAAACAGARRRQAAQPGRRT